eukprot:CAMPEP_0197899290 /NCGR_PEP_ID=MMETSP1439-20131203/46132_1 /TAXON_ID=66791 /ORGANISM="Gonyaulax spinifera, Strain CCMP409" /LENGTH=60 /DNA_ID=CAMNT_0043520079 /DNA_START=129 /DNA_END=307 /DNA_ORIENTATION=+
MQGLGGPTLKMGAGSLEKEHMRIGANVQSRMLDYNVVGARAHQIKIGHGVTTTAATATAA